MAKVFFSYSHADENLRNRLEKHLSSLKRQGFIETWHDRRITAGGEFDGEIRQNLEDSQVILLLVSADFIASDYCYDVEVQHALERHESDSATVIPVILRSCDWHSAPFGKLLAAPTDGKPIILWQDQDQAFVDVVEKIKLALNKYSKTCEHNAAAVSSGPRTVMTMGSHPRSSNLAINSEPTEQDIDTFLDESYDYIFEYFNNSQTEIAERNKRVTTRFKKNSETSFSGTIYVAGTAASKCTIRLGGMMGKSITYSQSDNPDDGGCNDFLSCDHDGDELFLSPSGMMHFGERKKRLTREESAEHFWSAFVAPLQR